MIEKLFFRFFQIFIISKQTKEILIIVQNFFPKFCSHKININYIFVQINNCEAQDCLKFLTLNRAHLHQVLTKIYLERYFSLLISLSSEIYRCLTKFRDIRASH